MFELARFVDERMAVGDVVLPECGVAKVAKEDFLARRDRSLPNHPQHVGKGRRARGLEQLIRRGAGDGVGREDRGTRAVLPTIVLLLQ